MSDKLVTAKSLFNQDNIQKKFKELLGKKAQGFITSVLQIVASNDMLAGADPMSIYNAAAMAATLDLPLNNNLGFAWIVPYNVRQKDGSSKVMAQFQIGAKGFKQLAIRTGLFEIINNSDVRQGEIKSWNRLTGEMIFEWTESEAERLKLPVIGFVSYFRLKTGFSQTFYMSIDNIKHHGKKYSKTFSNKNGLWETDLEVMALKTVSKLNLSKNAPLSIELQSAILLDQGIIKNDQGTEIEYIDNEDVTIDKEAERLRLMIEDAAIIEELKALQSQIDPEGDLANMLLEKMEQLKK